MIATDVSSSRLHVVDASINESRESICERGLFRGGVRTDRERGERATRYRKSRSSFHGTRRRNVDLVNHAAGSFSRVKTGTEEQNFRPRAEKFRQLLASHTRKRRRRAASRRPRLATHLPFFMIDMLAALRFIAKASARNCERCTLDASGFPG